MSYKSYTSGLFYIISPAFKVSESNRFIAAGPFLVEGSREGMEADRIGEFLIRLDEIELDTRKNKMSKLYHLLSNKAKVETTYSIPERILEVIESLGDLDYNVVDYNQYNSKVLNDLLRIESFDFLGLALKNQDDVFVIKHICGEHVRHLADKKFYIGEGLLGKAVITGQNLYWSKGSDNHKAEFFNRHGVFPNHLFGFPIKEDETVVGMIFGGSFKDMDISKNLLKALNFIVHFISQRKTNNAKLRTYQYIEAVFYNWLELMDVTTYAKESKHVFYKILDFCQTVNNGKFTCFSSTNGDFMYRGDMSHDILTLHRDIAGRSANPSPVSLWVEQHCIHFYILMGQQQQGLFTIEFAENADLRQASCILGMVNTFFRQSGLESSNELPPHKDESIFEVLHSSMGEMNDKQYHATHLAMKVLSRLAAAVQISQEHTELLLNICRVLPYNQDYLVKRISHTPEWRLMQEMYTLPGRTDSEELSVSTKILGFIYIGIIKEDKKASWDFLDHDLKELCMSTLEACHDSSHECSGTTKVEIGHEQIEELTDLKSVILTLDLTNREKEILHLILEGLNNNEVGQYLKISVHTVKNHVTNIFKKLNVTDRVHAMAKIYRIKYGED
ncbi:LuxR C-terminal-related transcriptional regulator [Paenibacillus sp. YPG26]|uniref:LuxR C-terminal-related transcriptional regulator n=1 Tax=Paenibacillus sp. YPG26 TaxID=2878915 RepID=UPI00203CD89B|nr:LuxR C-terminal-related transcriptional regulator [Paenibacillus sp. YPG26]USB31745.1 LuxR C-terminal-related transcriptional regulator [Paenibacillus sp. YPG26]